jgi:sulfur carrier protein ThiS
VVNGNMVLSNGQAVTVKSGDEVTILAMLGGG